MSDTSPCEYTPEGVMHHSDDAVELYYGRTTPMIVCGFHAQEVFRSDVHAYRREQEQKARTA